MSVGDREKSDITNQESNSELPIVDVLFKVVDDLCLEVEQHKCDGTCSSDEQCSEAIMLNARLTARLGARIRELRAARAQNVRALLHEYSWNFDTARFKSPVALKNFRTALRVVRQVCDSDNVQSSVKSKPTSLTAWECQKCSFANKPDFLMCEMCLQQRPSTNVLNVETPASPTQKRHSRSTSSSLLTDDGSNLEWQQEVGALGQRLDACDCEGEWVPATVIEAKFNSATGRLEKLFISYELWDPKWDEWVAVPSDRIAPFKSHRMQYRWPPGAHLRPEFDSSSYSHFRKLLKTENTRRPPEISDKAPGPGSEIRCTVPETPSAVVSEGEKISDIPPNKTIANDEMIEAVTKSLAASNLSNPESKSQLAKSSDILACSISDLVDQDYVIAEFSDLSPASSNASPTDLTRPTHSGDPEFTLSPTVVPESVLGPVGDPGSDMSPSRVPGSDLGPSGVSEFDIGTSGVESGMNPSGVESGLNQSGVESSLKPSGVVSGLDPTGVESGLNPSVPSLIDESAVIVQEPSGEDEEWDMLPEVAPEVKIQAQPLIDSCYFGPKGEPA
eukprot:242393_1